MYIYMYGKVGMLFLHSKLMHKKHCIEYLKIYQQTEQTKNCHVKQHTAYHAFCCILCWNANSDYNVKQRLVENDREGWASQTLSIISPSIYVLLQHVFFTKTNIHRKA